MIYAHQITFQQLQASKEAVCDLQGRMIGGPDTKMESDWTKWVSWQKAIQKAPGGSVPPDVMAYFQKTKGLTKVPTRIDVEDAILIAPTTELPLFKAEVPTIMSKPFTPPRFTWSYTSMAEFLTCPAQWAAKRYYKTIKDVESESMRVGNMIHETAEHYLKSKIGQTFKPSSIHTQYLPVVQKYCDALIASGAELHVEKEMCFDKQMKVSAWKAWDTVWVRSKADVLAKNGTKLSICDWKTGKYKEDFLQLKMFAVFAALTPGFEDVQEFDPKFIFTKEAPPKNILRLPEPIRRSELKGVLGEILGVVRRMEAAWESATFPAKRNGLCRNWCSNTDCTHCGG
ncbi:MAG TPA: hypothetical protein DCS07_12770 [Bdellovibrionales bacterium]|nr:hypothetical protein [Bdellovibrionales bacterium]